MWNNTREAYNLLRLGIRSSLFWILSDLHIQIWRNIMSTYYCFTLQGIWCWVICHASVKCHIVGVWMSQTCVLLVYMSHVHVVILLPVLFIMWVSWCVCVSWHVCIMCMSYVCVCVCVFCVCVCVCVCCMYHCMSFMCHSLCIMSRVWWKAGQLHNHLYNIFIIYYWIKS